MDTKRQFAAGLVIVRQSGNNFKFLLLYHGKGYWNFPKGKIESEEKSWQAAFREVKEETGLHPNDLRVCHGFRVYDRYYFGSRNARVAKSVVFFLAETNVVQIKISEEHEGYGWFSFHEAIMILKHKNTRSILKRAYEFLRPRFLRRIDPGIASRP